MEGTAVLCPYGFFVNVNVNGNENGNDYSNSKSRGC